jgi:hypothetical protein
MELIPNEILIYKIFPLLWEDDIICLLLSSKKYCKLIELKPNLYLCHLRRLINNNNDYSTLVLRKWNSLSLQMDYGFWKFENKTKYLYINQCLTYDMTLKLFPGMRPVCLYYLFKRKIFRVDIPLNFNKRLGFQHHICNILRRKKSISNPRIILILTPIRWYQRLIM